MIFFIQCGGNKKQIAESQFKKDIPPQRDRNIDPQKKDNFIQTDVQKKKENKPTNPKKNLSFKERVKQELPGIPYTAKEIKDFIPKNYKLHQQITGDFNEDGFEDVAIYLGIAETPTKDKSKQKNTQSYGLGGFLLILLNMDSNYKISGFKFLKSINEYVESTKLELEDNIILFSKIGHSYYGPFLAKSFDFKELIKIQFNHVLKRFILIGSERESKGSHPGYWKEHTSTNYLTGKRITKSTGPSSQNIITSTEDNIPLKPLLEDFNLYE